LAQKSGMSFRIRHQIKVRGRHAYIHAFIFNPSFDEG